MDNTIENYLSELLRITGIPVRTVELPCRDWDWLDAGIRRDVLGMDDYSRRISDSVGAVGRPAMYRVTDSLKLSYIAVRLSVSQCVIVGPVLYEQPTPELLDSVTEPLGLPEAAVRMLRDRWYAVKYVPMREFLENAVQLACDDFFGAGNYVSVAMESGPGSAVSYLPGRARAHSHPDEPEDRTRQAQELVELENRMLRAASCGDDRTALECMERMRPFLSPPRLASEIPYFRDFIIGFNALMRKTAERSGVPAVQAEALSRSCQSRVRELRTSHECQAFIRRLTRDYCAMVREHDQNGMSLPVRRVMTTVRSRLTGDLSLKALSEELNMNASYLSSLFSRETGETVTRFVNRCRVEHAQMLLITSDLTVKEIAQQCGVPDMYYFILFFN